MIILSNTLDFVNSFFIIFLIFLHGGFCRGRLAPRGRGWYNTRMAEYKHIKREFGPVYDANSKILILGSFPSVKSRQANFFYGHPQNRFWPLLSRVLECDFPADTGGKRAMLLARGVALWDVIEECDIIGSSDSSIRNVMPVDIMAVLNAADIRAIYCNGAASYSLFMRYLAPLCGRTPVKLPSTSPANAAWSMERLYGEWRQIRAALD